MTGRDYPISATGRCNLAHRSDPATRLRSDIDRFNTAVRSGKWADFSVAFADGARARFRWAGGGTGTLPSAGGPARSRP